MRAQRCSSEFRPRAVSAVAVSAVAHGERYGPRDFEISHTRSPRAQRVSERFAVLRFDDVVARAVDEERRWERDVRGMGAPRHAAIIARCAPAERPSSTTRDVSPSQSPPWSAIHASHQSTSSICAVVSTMIASAIVVDVTRRGRNRSRATMCARCHGVAGASDRPCICASNRRTAAGMRIQTVRARPSATTAIATAS